MKKLVPPKLSLTAFEKQILEILNFGIPEPRLALWMEVIDADGDKGQVVGLLWKSVDESFRTQSAPGWHYHVRMGTEILLLHEDDLRNREEDLREVAA